MDTLHDRLQDLARDAPTGGAPAAELWARGKRTHRIRAAALAAALLVVSAAGTGIGVRLADADGNPPNPAPAGPTGISLPIQYPVGQALPDLGAAPGPLAAVWMVPRGVGTAPEVVGLVAETETFGTLPIDVRPDGALRRTNTQGWEPGDPAAPDWMTISLSADGRSVAYFSPKDELIVHDLVTGVSSSPLAESGIKTRTETTWIDATHLFGLVAAGSDADGWVWEPGTAPKLVDTYAFAEGFDLWINMQGSGPLPYPGERECWSPNLLDGTGEYGDLLEVPVLCDVLGIIGSETLLGHWNSDRVPGDWNDPRDGNGTVVALDISGADSSFEDPALRRVVATAGAPQRVTFASDLIGDALEAEGRAS